MISGGAQGIDACARSYAKQKGLAITEIFPCYARYSRAAPLRRNEEKFVRRADMVLAFWDGESKGTAYTIRYAQKQGKPPDGALPATAGRTPPRHGLKSKNSSSTKPGEKNRPVCPQSQSGKSVCFCG